MELKVDDIIIHVRWKKFYKIKSFYTNFQSQKCFIAVDFSGSYNHSGSYIGGPIINFSENFRRVKGKLAKHLYG